MNWVQPSIIFIKGFYRPIDDGKRFGHNSASGFEETIECCSAFQPAVHARALAQQAVLQGCNDLLSQQMLETGGEDMPEAYRWVPADPREGSLNVIATWSVDDNCWLFQEMFGQVFGRAAAVINFHRIQRLLVAIVRIKCHTKFLITIGVYCFNCEFFRKYINKFSSISIFTSNMF